VVDDILIPEVVAHAPATMRTVRRPITDDLETRTVQSVAFGALVPSLSNQLRLPARLVRHAQRDADAITRLAVRGLLTEREAHAARRRLTTRLSTIHRDYTKQRGVRRG